MFVEVDTDFAYLIGLFSLKLTISLSCDALVDNGKNLFVIPTNRSANTSPDIDQLEQEFEQQMKDFDEEKRKILEEERAKS